MQRNVNNEFDFVVVCDGCGPVAGFTSVNAALGYGHQHAYIHYKCVPTDESNNTDGKRISVLNLTARFGHEVAGRY